MGRRVDAFTVRPSVRRSARAFRTEGSIACRTRPQCSAGSIPSTVIEKLPTAQRTLPQVRAGPRIANTNAKRISLQILRYLTNDVVAHLPFSGLRHLWYRRLLGMQIAKGAIVLMHVTVSFYGRPRHDRTAGISIGRRSIIGRECWLDGRGGIRIGDDVSINRGAWLVTGAHDLRDPSFSLVHAPIVIGDRAFFGSRALVLQGVTIGEGAVVAAGAVVTRDVPPYTIVAGNPARAIGTRPRDQRYQLDYAPELE